jgi:hypothetical protein
MLSHIDLFFLFAPKTISATDPTDNFSLPFNYQQFKEISAVILRHR